MKYCNFLPPVVASIGALLIADGAHAQVEQGASNKRSYQLEEVVVTARRREESLQDSPVAVTAMTGEGMREKGITNIGDLTKSVPSLQIASPQSTQVYIRGVGERTGFTRVDPTVGIYLDGLYIPQTDGALLDVLQISSVQVLRGPQGTLFGKNTTGGAIVMTLEKPSQEYSANLTGGLGNYNLRELSGSINGGLSEHLTASFGFSSVKTDGYTKDISGYETGNEDTITGVLQTRWDYSEFLTIDSMLYYGKSDETVLGANCKVNNVEALTINGLYIQWPGDTSPSEPSPATPSAWIENCEANSEEVLGDLTTNLGENAAIALRQTNMLFGTTVDWAFSENHHAKVVLGWQDGLEEGPLQTNDSDGGPQLLLASYNIDDSNRNSYSVELQFNGSFFDSRLSYSSGLFYMAQTSNEQFGSLFGLAGLDGQTLAQLGTMTQPTAPPGSTPFVGIFSGPLSISDFSLENNTLAVYGQASADLSNYLQLTLGIRYTKEDRTSELEIIGPDRDAIANRITGTHIGPFGPVTFGAPVEGLHPCACSWAQDPVSVAHSLFPDADGDGIPDYPLDYENTQKEKRSEDFSKTTPMITLSYDLSDSNWLMSAFSADSAMVYGTWSIGFKSGFFEPNGSDGLQRVEPETVENREIGFKMDALDRSVRFNAALYQMDYEDQQLFQVAVDSAGAVGVIFKNVGQSEITGAEMELTWLPAPGWLINISASHNEYDIKKFDDVDIVSLILGDPQMIDRSDENFPVSPEDTFALGVQYMWETDFGLITPRIDYSYKSDIYLGLDASSWDVYQKDKSLAGQEAYGLLDARLSWSNLEGDTSIALWVRNALDERYTVGPVATAETTGTFNLAYGAPRQFGIQIRKEFY